MDGCQTKLLYRVVSYLIIDNMTEEDSGLYTFSIITTYHGYPPIHQSRYVDVSVSKCSTITSVLILATFDIFSMCKR